MKECINPVGLMAPKGAYSQVVRNGDLVFLAGMVPRGRTGELMGTDIEAQTRAVLDNMRLALEAVGASVDDVCSVTTYLSDMERDFAAYNAAYATTFGQDPPARTTVQATLRDILIEVQCIAVLHSEDA